MLANFPVRAVIGFGWGPIHPGSCVVDFIMDNVYSISLSKKRLPDGQAHDGTGLDS